MQKIPPAPTSRSGRTGRTIWGGAIATIIVILLVVAFLQLRQLPLSSPAVLTRGIGGGGPCPTATPFSHAITLYDMNMVSPDEGWAVGGVLTFGGASSEGIILHNVHGQWQQVSGDFKDMLFTSISMTSSTDGWLAGIIHNNMPNGNTVFQGDRLLYHYDGHAWKAVSFDQSAFNNNYGGSPGDLIVRMYSAMDGWLMLRDTTLLGNFTLLHYDGTTWRTVQSPFISTDSPSYTFYDVRVPGPDEVWLAGEHLPGPNAVIAHYQAGTWSTVANSAGYVESLTLTSATDGWAIDSEGNRILHFTERQASPVSLPVGLLQAHEWLIAVFAAPDGTIWVIGDTDSPTTTAPFLLHRLADGTWKRTTIPYPHEGIGKLIFTSPSDIWAVGAIAYQQGCAPAEVTELGQGTILHWNGAKWSQTVEPVS